jgi:hypothetical protein
MLAPVYRLLGGSAWALQVSAAFLNAVALTAAVFIAWRRRRLAVVGAVGVGLALLTSGYGLSTLTEPWNPNFPVLWFAVFLVAAWSVAIGDVAMMLIVVTTASICAQTHIAYVPVCGGLGTLAIATAFVLVVRAEKGSEERIGGRRWLALSCALLAVLWLPPIVQELTDDTGNVSRLIQYFADPDNPPIGMHQALPLMLSHLDSWHVLLNQSITSGNFAEALPDPSPEPWRGLITLLLWVVCAVGSVPLGNRFVLALHGLVLSGIGVGTIAASRIVGYPYSYVMYWTWGLGVLPIVGCLVTVGSALVRISSQSLRPRLATVAAVLPVGLSILFSIRLAFAATDVRPMHYRQARELKALSIDTVAAIHRRAGVASGVSGRYLVSSSDGLHGGSLGIGLGNELERAGLETAYPLELAQFLAKGRARPSQWATARIQLATGAWIDECRRIPGAVEVAWVDLRTAEELAEAETLRTVVIEGLYLARRADLVEQIDYDLTGMLAARPEVDPYILLAMYRLSEIGGPAVVFIMPPHAIPNRRKR